MVDESNLASLFNAWAVPAQRLAELSAANSNFREVHPKMVAERKIFRGFATTWSALPVEARLASFRELLGKILRDEAPGVNAWNWIFDYVWLEPLPWTERDMLMLIECYLQQPVFRKQKLEEVIRLLMSFLKTNRFSLEALETCRQLIRVAEFFTHSPDQETANGLAEMRRVVGWPVNPNLFGGEVWSNQAIEEIEGQEDGARRAWNELLYFSMKSNGKAPRKGWTAEAEELLSVVSKDDFSARISRWFPLVAEPKLFPLQEEVAEHKKWAVEVQNEKVLLGLAWLCSLCDGAKVSSPLGNLAESYYRTVFLNDIPVNDMRIPRVGDGCVYALKQLPGGEAAAELARLKESGVLQRERKGKRWTEEHRPHF